MRTALLLSAVAIATPLSAQAAPNACSAFAPPERPVNSEDFNPGLGGELGLNDDFHDDIWEPFDEPGVVISTLTRELAQDDEAGAINLVPQIAGLDCSEL
jgi:hypothetical protein